MDETDTESPALRSRGRCSVGFYNWDRSHEALGGLCPIDRVCERIDKTPLWGDVDAAHDEARERLQVREYAVEMALRKLK